MLTRQLTNNKQPDSFSTTTLLSNVTHIYFSCYFEDDYWKRLAAAFFLFFPDLAVIGAAEIVGAELIVGASVGLLVLLLFFFSAFFFAALAVTGAADTVGAALMVGWFVGLLVLDRFCTRRSVIIMPAAASLEAVHAKEDSPKASSATDS